MGFCTTNAKVCLIIASLICLFNAHIHELNIGALIELNSANSTLVKIRQAAIELAVQNMKKDWGFPINFFFGNSGCNGQQSIGEFARLKYKHHVNAIIGPSCNDGCVTGGHLATYHNMVMVSHSCSAAQMSNKVKYPTFGRVRAYASASPLSTTKALVKFLNTMNWQRIGIIHSNDESWSAAATTIKNDLENATIAVPFHKDYIRGHSISSAHACMKAVSVSSIRSVYILSMTKICIHSFIHSLI